MIGASLTHGAGRPALRMALAAMAILAIGAAGLGGYLAGELSEAARGAALPILGQAPSYDLTNQLGRTFNSAALKGKIQVVSFMFPYCTTMCPLIAAHLVNLENLGLVPARLTKDVEFVSFDIDPAHTGPAQMRAFLSEYGWNPKDPRWQYLTGSPGEIRLIVKKKFGVWYKRVKNAPASKAAGPQVEQPEVVNKLAEAAHVDYDIDHDDIVEIVDQHGGIRKIYQNADAADWTHILNVIATLAKAGGQD